MRRRWVTQVLETAGGTAGRLAPHVVEVKGTALKFHIADESTGNRCLRWRLAAGSHPVYMGDVVKAALARGIIGASEEPLVSRPGGPRNTGGTAGGHERREQAGAGVLPADARLGPSRPCLRIFRYTPRKNRCGWWKCCAN